MATTAMSAEISGGSKTVKTVYNALLKQFRFTGKTQVIGAVDIEEV